ncbi:uncharacterized protein LOC111885503 [Lactuca sativa]|uniref:uncharacterized protein LOC111885503 n=1 Tax=Lactuca sativa TaxID=4236 RepID=UPI000CD84DE6|nr:uncharacterized protein LOC111885503 [Lactuca sativa]
MQLERDHRSSSPSRLTPHDHLHTCFTPIVPHRRRFSARRIAIPNNFVDDVAKFGNLDLLSHRLTGVLFQFDQLNRIYHCWNKGIFTRKRLGLRKETQVKTAIQVEATSQEIFVAAEAKLTDFKQILER